MPLGSRNIAKEPPKSGISCGGIKIFPPLLSTFATAASRSSTEYKRLRGLYMASHRLFEKYALLSPDPEMDHTDEHRWSPVKFPTQKVNGKTQIIPHRFLPAISNHMTGLPIGITPLN